MSEALEFLVMVDSSFSHREFAEFLKRLFPTRTSERPWSFVVEENLVELRANDDYDSEKSKDKEEGFLYMRYRIEVTPLSNLRTEVEQISLARQLQNHIEASGGRAVICASFEDRL